MLLSSHLKNDSTGNTYYMEENTLVTKEINKRNQLFFQMTEWAALIAVIHLCIFRFLETTTFWFPFDDTFRTITFSAVTVLGILRLLSCAVNKFQKALTKKEKGAVILKILLVIILSAPCIIIADHFEYREFAYIPFVAFCLYGIDTDKVLKVFTICIGVMLAVTILNALSGSIENILYLGKGAKGRLRGSYGVGYPTDFASYFIFLFLFFWTVQKRQSIGHTAVFFGLALLMTYGIYIYPRSDTSTICGIVIALVVLYDWLSARFLSRHKGTKLITKIVDLFTISAFPLFAVGIYILTWLYGHGNGFAIWLDKCMSSRICWIWESYLKYGIHAFGALTPQNGAGGSMIHTETYEFLDSTYGLFLIRYGWVLTLIVAVLWVWMTKKAIRAGHRRLALAMAVIAFHSISEHHFPEINFNVLLAMPLCSFALISQPQEKPVITKEIWSGWLAGAAVAVPFVLLLPRMLSRTRGFFAIEGWIGGGERTISALFYWLICLVILIATWLLLRRLLTKILKHGKGYIPVLAGLMAVALIGMAGFIWVDRQISAGAKDYEPQMIADASAVETVMSAAKDPVYAGQAEEFYKRTFNGFSDRILSSEELCRSGRGSIFLEHDNEGYQLINTGALYTEISPYTGLFTYDDALVETLTAEGYRFHGYYSAEREVDLAEAARMNGLEITENGQLKLSGPEHSLIYGPYLDQFGGTYTVTFDLQMTKEEQQKHTAGEEIGTLRASEQWGGRIRSEQVIQADDFDAEGMLTVNLNYNVGNTRGVEYLVFCRDNAEILVNRIAWRSNPATDIWRKYTEEGLIQSERYFTAEGEPLEQPAGHYGVAYEYAKGSTDRSKTQYLDADGKTLKKISSGYDQILDQWDALHHITKEQYLDSKGDSCLCTGNYAGFRREYDSRGNVVFIQYFDIEDKPICTTSGYAAIEYSYDDANNRIYERYLDEDGTPILLSNGYAEIHKEYNNNHQIIKETYFGTNGEARNQAKGQAGVLYDYDENGNTVLWKYLDKIGNPVTITDGWAEMYRAYDEKKRIIEESYYNEKGEPTLIPSGYAALQREYDNVGNVITERYLDKNGNPTANTNGYAEIRRDFNSDNRVIRETYFDTDGKPKALSKNQAIIEYDYDDAGNCILYRYLDTEGTPILLTDGWAELHRVFNGKRQIVEESFYGTDGQLLMRPNGYAVAEYAYDETNNRNYERYLDTERKPVLNTSGYAELHRVFNINNRVIKDTYYNETGNPIVLAKGQGGVEYDYDAAGNQVLIRYLDTEGKQVQLTDNYSELRRIYSESRKLLEESYYDLNGKPCNAYGRYTKFQNEYDENDQLSLTYYTDKEGNSIRCGSSFFHEYLQSLKYERPNVIVFIAVRDEATNSLTNTLLEDLKEIGIETNLKGKVRYGYYAIITPEGSIEELSDTETISHSGQIGDLSYTITSGGYLVGNTSSILINGEDYSKNSRGMNFVIVDNDTHEVLESIGFDTYTQEMQVTR